MEDKKFYTYDIALSFSGEDRAYVENIARLLKKKNIKVFYDYWERRRIWGTQLDEELENIYKNKAKYCVIFFSKHYLNSDWATHELRSAQKRAAKDKREYILPILLDGTALPESLNKTAVIETSNHSIQDVYDLIVSKISSDNIIDKKSILTLDVFSKIEFSAESNVVNSLFSRNIAIAKQSQLYKFESSYYPFLLLYDKAIFVNFMDLIPNSECPPFYDLMDSAMTSISALMNMASRTSGSIDTSKPDPIQQTLSRNVKAGLIENYIVKDNQSPVILAYIKNFLEHAKKKASEEKADGHVDLELAAEINISEITQDCLLDVVVNEQQCMKVDLNYASSEYTEYVDNISRSYQDNNRMEKINILALGIFSRSLNFIPNLNKLCTESFLTIREKINNDRTSILRSLQKLSRSILQDIDNITEKELIREVDYLVSSKILPDMKEYASMLGALSPHNSYLRTKTELNISAEAVYHEKIRDNIYKSNSATSYDYSIFIKSLATANRTANLTMP